jgi:thiol-disulfide isomerase/thioredoxin
MWARLSIVAGLVVGIVVAGLVLGGIFAFAPDPPPPSTPAPTTPLATSSPSPAVSAAPAAIPSPTASPSPSTSAVPSASAGDAPFHIGEAAPPLSFPKVGGWTIDPATLRGKPVWINFMATWCPSCRDEFPQIMPGVDVKH